VIDFVNKWSENSEIAKTQILSWLSLRKGKFHDWSKRYGKANEHNGLIPRDYWLETWEKEAIIDFHAKNPLNGYRRLCFMMLDSDIVAVSPATVYNVLKAAGLIDKRNWRPSKKGTGFVQPLKAHDHWHIDVTYINIAGTFYYLTSILDGFSRYIVHWELKERMTEKDVELIVQKALEGFPGFFPRIISDNGPQFIARDFKEFVRLCGMSHVRTSPFYPQSNGKLERWHGELKRECIRPKAPTSFEEAVRVVGDYVTEYNDIRLHSAIGYVTPRDKLRGREKEIFVTRDKKLEAARENRKNKRQVSSIGDILVSLGSLSEPGMKSERTKLLGEDPGSKRTEGPPQAQNLSEPCGAAPDSERFRWWRSLLY
jgi:putative transposase